MRWQKQNQMQTSSDEKSMDNIIPFQSYNIPTYEQLFDPHKMTREELKENTAEFNPYTVQPFNTLSI